ncbi:MAG: hypothetical protein IPH20_19200 [Bacteroidales bacterium]|nr:hypothetical protein [Bacteroidales bacterium]
MLFINISGKEGLCEIELKENILFSGNDRRGEKTAEEKLRKVWSPACYLSIPNQCMLDHEIASGDYWMSFCFTKEISECAIFNSVNEDLKRIL